MPIGFPPDGLAGCVQAGAEKASAATTATLVRRCFMGVDPPLQLGRYRRLGPVNDGLGRPTASGVEDPPRSSSSYASQGCQGGLLPQPLTLMDFGPNRHH